MSEARQILKQKIDDEIKLYYNELELYPEAKYEKLLTRWSDDSVYSEKHRFDLLKEFIPDIKTRKTLDMAAGCGSFVIQGFLNGYNTFGVEPEMWKHMVVDIKFEENNYPAEWRSRIKQGVGEQLPFDDESFDAFDSWQTIEHVASERDCINELYRVLRKGGKGILRGPDYLSFYEGHYGFVLVTRNGKK